MSSSIPPPLGLRVLCGRRDRKTVRASRDGRYQGISAFQSQQDWHPCELKRWQQHEAWIGPVQVQPERVPELKEEMSASPHPWARSYLQFTALTKEILVCSNGATGYTNYPEADSQHKTNSMVCLTMFSLIMLCLGMFLLYLYFAYLVWFLNLCL